MTDKINIKLLVQIDNYPPSTSRLKQCSIYQAIRSATASTKSSQNIQFFQNDNAKFIEYQ
jgi:hypothetical protein